MHDTSVITDLEKSFVMDESVAIFLIHGTFARGAAWTTQDSTFRTQLEKDLNALNYHDVRFHVFEWNGRNTHKDRRQAAVCFERILRSSIRRDPSTRHFVVAHSHGGNIAIRALRRSRHFSEMPVGVITLATPFLKFTKMPSSFIIWPLLSLGFVKSLLFFAYLIIIFPFQIFVEAVAGSLEPLFGTESKNLRRFRYVLSGFVVVTINGVLLALIVWLGGGFLERWGPTPGHWAGGLFASVFTGSTGAFVTTAINLALLTIGVASTLFLAYVYALSEVSWASLRKIIRKRRKIFQRFTYTQPESSIQDPVLCLSSGIDEALGVLSGVWMMHRTTSFFVRSLIMAVLVGITALTAQVIYEWTTYITASKRNDWLTAVFWDTGTEWALVLGFLAIAWAVWGVVKILGKLVGYSSVGLGMANPDFNLLWRVNAQRDPRLGKNVEQKRFGLKEIMKGSTGLLFHSRLYTHPKAINEVALWMHKQQQSDFNEIHILAS